MDVTKLHIPPFFSRIEQDLCVIKKQIAPLIQKILFPEEYWKESIGFFHEQVLRYQQEIKKIKERLSTSSEKIQYKVSKNFTQYRTISHLFFQIALIEQNLSKIDETISQKIPIYMQTEQLDSFMTYGLRAKEFLGIPLYLPKDPIPYSFREVSLHKVFEEIELHKKRPAAADEQARLVILLAAWKTAVRDKTLSPITLLQKINELLSTPLSDEHFSPIFDLKMALQQLISPKSLHELLIKEFNIEHKIKTALSCIASEQNLFIILKKITDDWVLFFYNYDILASLIDNNLPETTTPIPFPIQSLIRVFKKKLLDLFRRELDTFSIDKNLFQQTIQRINKYIQKPYFLSMLIREKQKQEIEPLIQTVREYLSSLSCNEQEKEFLKTITTNSSNTLENNIKEFFALLQKNARTHIEKIIDPDHHHILIEILKSLTDSSIVTLTQEYILKAHLEQSRSHIPRKSHTQYINNQLAGMLNHCLHIDDKDSPREIYLQQQLNPLKQKNATPHLNGTQEAEETSIEEIVHTCFTFLKSASFQDAFFSLVLKKITSSTTIYEEIVEQLGAFCAQLKKASEENVPIHKAFYIEPGTVSLQAEGIFNILYTELYRKSITVTLIEASYKPIEYLLFLQGIFSKKTIDCQEENDVIKTIRSFLKKSQKKNLSHEKIMQDLTSMISGNNPTVTKEPFTLYLYRKYAPLVTAIFQRRIIELLKKKSAILSEKPKQIPNILNTVSLDSYWIIPPIENHAAIKTKIEQLASYLINQLPLIEKMLEDVNCGVQNCIKKKSISTIKRQIKQKIEHTSSLIEQYTPSLFDAFSHEQSQEYVQHLSYRIYALFLLRQEIVNLQALIDKPSTTLATIENALYTFLNNSATMKNWHGLYTAIKNYRLLEKSKTTTHFPDLFSLRNTCIKNLMKDIQKKTLQISQKEKKAYLDILAVKMSFEEKLLPKELELFLIKKIIQISIRPKIDPELEVLLGILFTTPYYCNQLSATQKENRILNEYLEGKNCSFYEEKRDLIQHARTLMLAKNNRVMESREYIEENMQKQKTRIKQNIDTYCSNLVLPPGLKNPENVRKNIQESMYRQHAIDSLESLFTLNEPKIISEGKIPPCESSDSSLKKVQSVSEPSLKLPCMHEKYPPGIHPISTSEELLNGRKTTCTDSSRDAQRQKRRSVQLPVSPIARDIGKEYIAIPLVTPPFLKTHEITSQEQSSKSSSSGKTLSKASLRKAHSSSGFSNQELTRSPNSSSIPEEPLSEDIMLTDFEITCTDHSKMTSRQKRRSVQLPASSITVDKISLSTPPFLRTHKTTPLKQSSRNSSDEELPLYESSLRKTQSALEFSAVIPSMHQKYALSSNSSPISEELLSRNITEITYTDHSKKGSRQKRKSIQLSTSSTKQVRRMPPSTPPPLKPHEITLSRQPPDISLLYLSPTTKEHNGKLDLFYRRYGDTELGYAIYMYLKDKETNTHL